MSLSVVALAVNPDSDANRKKARYYYLEGVRKAAEGRNSEAVEYYKKAYLIDSTYSEAANSYGTLRFWTYTDTLQSEPERRKSLAMMRSFVDAYPADLTESLIYGYASESVDTLSREGKSFQTVPHPPASLSRSPGFSPRQESLFLLDSDLSMFVLRARQIS